MENLGLMLKAHNKLNLKFNVFLSLYAQGNHSNQMKERHYVTLVRFNPFRTRVTIRTEFFRKIIGIRISFNPFRTRVTIRT